MGNTIGTARLVNLDVRLTHSFSPWGVGQNDICRLSSNVFVEQHPLRGFRNDLQQAFSIFSRLTTAATLVSLVQNRCPT